MSTPRFQDSLTAFQRIQESLDILQNLLTVEKPSKEDLDHLADIWNGLLFVRTHVLQSMVQHPMMKVANANDALKRALVQE